MSAPEFWFVNKNVGPSINILPPLPIFVYLKPWHPSGVPLGFRETQFEKHCSNAKEFPVHSHINRWYVSRCENAESPGLDRTKSPLQAIGGNTDTAATVAAPFHYASVYFHDNYQIYVGDINIIFTTFLPKTFSLWQIFGELHSRRM
jgi:hypothetical protein